MFCPAIIPLSRKFFLSGANSLSGVLLSHPPSSVHHRTTSSFLYRWLPFALQLGRPHHMISYLSGCWLLFAYPAPASPFSLHLPDRAHCTAGASRASSQQLQLYSVPPTSFGSLLLQTDNGNGNAFLEEVVTTNNNNTPTQKFRCNICSRGFDKQKQYKEHLVGKKHNAIMDQADDAWREYQNSGPVFFDETVAREVVIAVWSLDLFVDGLQGTIIISRSILV